MCHYNLFHHCSLISAMFWERNHRGWVCRSFVHLDTWVFQTQCWMDELSRPQKSRCHGCHGWIFDISFFFLGGNGIPKWGLRLVNGWNLSGSMIFATLNSVAETLHQFFLVVLLLVMTRMRTMTMTRRMMMRMMLLMMTMMVMVMMVVMMMRMMRMTTTLMVMLMNGCLILKTPCHVPKCCCFFFMFMMILQICTISIDHFQQKQHIRGLGTSEPGHYLPRSSVEHQIVLG